MRSALVITALALMFGVTASARAQSAQTTTYVYKGTAYTLFTNYGVAVDSPYHCSQNNPCALSISLTLSAPLAPNVLDDEVSPLSFTISDGVSDHTVTDKTPNVFTTFILSTDAAGNISQWYISAETHGGEAPYIDLLSTNYPQDQVDETDIYSCPTCTAVEYEADASGTWSRSQG